MRTRNVAIAGMAVMAGLAGAAGQSFAGSAPSAAAPSADAVHFKMLRSTAALGADCLKGAGADVTITPRGPVEVMRVEAHNLPRNTEFDLFVIQQADAPFGDAWYQGDFESDEHGNGSGRFVGRFSTETFIVAPGTLPAPVVHDDGTFPDADSNPVSAPVHTFHLGLWFGSPEAAGAAGCPTALTPFNGDHTAGIQALSTRQFPDLKGPLSKIEP
jgi:hypothetical protein